MAKSPVFSCNEYLKEKRQAYLKITAFGRKKREAGEQLVATLTSKGRICGRSGIREVIDGGGHRFLTDVGAIWNGYDLAPSAPSSFICALNSCIMHTAAVIAAEQELDMDSCECELMGDYHVLGGYAGFEDEPTGPQDIRFTLTIDSKESPERLEQFLHDIERRCPVGSLLKVGPRGKLVNIHKDEE